MVLRHDRGDQIIDVDWEAEWDSPGIESWVAERYLTGGSEISSGIPKVVGPVPPLECAPSKSGRCLRSSIAGQGKRGIQPHPESSRLLLREEDLLVSYADRQSPFLPLSAAL